MVSGLSSIPRKCVNLLLSVSTSLDLSLTKTPHEFWLLIFQHFHPKFILSICSFPQFSDVYLHFSELLQHGFMGEKHDVFHMIKCGFCAVFFDELFLGRSWIYAFQNAYSPKVL